MNFVSEFYRSRDANEATPDRVSLEVPNLRKGPSHYFTLWPCRRILDRLRISDENGGELYAGPADEACPA
ncbi:hypothetical protein NKJ26_18960 [Mesorhizobium sp. M0152]|uniref:hypothetical protein n=1 Tax=unclassified Mesorhizobium TaxID=325217 RepID=UPI003334CE6F